MGDFLRKFSALTKLRRQRKERSFDMEKLSYDQAREKFSKIFEGKITEIKSEAEAIPQKYSEIKSDAHAKHGRELRRIERQKARELKKLSNEERYVRSRIKYIEAGGTKTTFSVFKSLDSNLKHRFSWYEKWSLNPLSAKVNLSAAGIYIFAFLFVVSFFAQIPKVSDASGTYAWKSTKVAQIDAKSSQDVPNLDNSSEPQKSISVDNVTVNFSDQNKTASTEIAATIGGNNETNAVKFTLLQSSGEKSESVSKNRSIWQKIAGIFQAEAEDSNEANPGTGEIKEATGIEVISSDEKNSVTYKVNDNLDLAYEVTKDAGSAKIKETAIIKDAIALSNDKLLFDVNLSGLSAVAHDDGSYDLVSGDGELVMQIAAPTIFDAEQNSGMVNLAIDETDGSATYSIDPEFVKTAKYPLYLDPTVTITTSTTTNPNSYSKDHTLFEATNGSMVNIYSDGSSLYYTISSDHGNTWGAGTKILDTATADDTGFSGWMTADNKIHLVYSNNGTNSYIFYRALTFDTGTNAITSTGTEYTVESAGTSQAFPSVTVSTAATIYVAYRYYDGANYTIKVKPSTATDGSTWDTAATISSGTNASAATYPELTLWGDNPAVVYNFANGSFRWNYYNGSAWQAAGWTNENISNEVDADTGLEFSLSQATSDHFLHLAWRGSSTNGILYRKLASASDTSKWDSASQAVTSSHDDRYPNLGLGLNDALYLYYSEYVGANSYNVKYVEKVGNTAFGSTKVSVTTDNANNLIPKAAMKGTSVQIAAYPASAYDLSFSGSSQYVNIGSGYDNFTSGLTFSIWAYPTNTNGWGRYFDLANGSANNNIMFARNGTTTNLTYDIYNGATSGGSVTANGVIELNKWQHFVVTETASGVVTIYKNGSVVGGSASFILPNNITRTSNYIAKSNWPDPYYAGQIDEPQIYNRALTSDEVTALYNGGSISQLYFSSGLVAGWHLEENSGTSIADYSGNGYTGALQGPPTWVSQGSGGVYTVPAISISSYSPVVFVSGTGPSYDINYAPTVKVWSAAADGNWETDANWTPSGAPAAGDIVLFDGTSTKNCTVTTYTGSAGGMGIADGIGSVSLNPGYTGTITFQKKPSQNADPYKINIAGDFAINAGTVLSQGDTSVAHGGVTDGRGNEYGSLNLIIGSSGTLSADSLGFPAFSGPGYGGTGTYGGQGYYSSANTYGDFSNPVSLGSGSANGISGGVSGGGAMLISVTDTADISGTMSANGQTSGAYAGAGGSGGSVNVSAKTISNSSGGGVISTEGGDATYTSAGGSPGGGGRISLQATTISYNGTLTAAGGVWNASRYASAGTIFKKAGGQSYGDLIIDNGTNAPDWRIFGAAHLKGINDTGSYQFDNLIIQNYGKLAIDTGQTFDLTGGVTGGDKNAGVINAGTITTPSTWTLNYFFADKNGTITNLANKDIIVSSTGRLTHYANANLETYKLNWQINNFTVQSGGEVITSGVGYAAGQGTGYTSGAGSSYGGDGYAASTTKAYGDYSNPINLGSGGSYAGGGGAIILNVTNTLDISGTGIILADGLSHGSMNNSAGSGGSVNLTASSITNSGGGGSITANGGNCTFSGGGFQPGGGGGRIKLEATTISYNGTITAVGGYNGNMYASGGTIYKKAGGQSYGDLIINNGTNTPLVRNQLSAHLKTSTDNGTYQFDSITFSGYGRLVVDANQTLKLDSGTISGNKTSGIVNAGTINVPDSWSLNHYYSDKGGTITNSSSKSLTITSTGLMTHYPNTTDETYKLNLNLSGLTVQSTGEINVGEMGNQTGYGSGYAAGVGASHGGVGGSSTAAKTYGDYTNPINIGSGGSGNGGGGNGGGAAIINVTNSLDISGTISASGGTYPGACYDYGSSGGSINLTAGQITGSGYLYALGGTVNFGCAARDGGGGGRIKAEATSIAGTLHYSAAGAPGAGTRGGSAGTIYKKITGESTGDLIIDNSTTSATAYTPLTMPVSLKVLTLQSNGRLEANPNADSGQNAFSISGDLTIASGTTMSVKGDADGTPAAGSWPALTVGGSASIAGTLTATGNGFIHDTGPESGKGLVAGGNGSGGGYGGAGGNSAGGAVGGQTYGDQRNNNYLGSGGGNTNGGSGGGMVKLSVAGNLALSTTGIISSDGNAGGANGGGGSGGSVQIVTGGTLSGSGSAKITTNGGAGGSAGGGGGGGRVTIYTASDSYTGALTANGGTKGTGAQDGSAGTILNQHSPTAPTITSPTDAATGQVQRIAFHFNSTDIDTDWIQYKLQLATDSGITQNVSTFDETVSQSPSDGGRSAAFSNQNMTTGKAAGTDGYESGRDAILTLTSDLTQGATYYYRVYAYDPEGVDSFDGTQHWSIASSVQSFTVAAIDRIAFSTAQQEIVVTFCSAEMTINLRNSANTNMNLTADDGSKTIHLASTSSGGKFYSDGNCQSELSGANVTIAPGNSASTFYYKDTVPSAVGGYWNITAAESPSAGWTDGSQNIRIKAGDFGSFEITGAPATIVAGQAFSSPANDITVTVKDVFGNVKNDWIGEIWFYSSDSQATFPYNDSSKYTFTSGEGLDNGTHTFAGTGFTYKTKGNQSLVVHNSEGSEHDAVTNVAVTPAATDHFGLASYPKTTQGYFAMASFAWNTPGYSNAPYTPAVTVYDQFNNVKDNFTGSVWFELYKSSDTPGNPGDSTASYSFDNDYTNPYTFTSGTGNDNGAHAFAGSGFIVNSAGSDLRFRVKTTDNGNKYSDFTISVKPQAIDHFGITASPTLSRGGTDWEKAVDSTFTEDVTVTAYDAFGNVKTDYGYDENTKAGMIYFYSSDTYAVLPYYKTVSTDSTHCYNFPADNTGTYTFTPENTPTNYFMFRTGGYQTISASECIDPTSDYATNVNTNRYDPRLEGTNPLKLAASIGSLPAANATPNKVFVSQHVPGSNHTATAHTNDANDLISAAPGHQQATISWYNPFDVPSDSNVHPQVYVYRCTLTDCNDPENFQKIITNPSEVAATPSTWGSYTDTGLTNGQDYYYRLSYAYEKQDSTYLESGFSNIVTVQPADIAPRNITAEQLDVSDPTNPGKIKINYDLRWASTISIAYFDPDLNSWHNASSSAQSGDVGAGITGDENLISHIAYLDPNVDFDGKYLEDSFKIRVKAQVNGNNAYSDSATMDLDSKNPVSTLVVDATAGSTANLAITGTDDTGPLKMMVSTHADYNGASWESFATSKSNLDITGATNVYLKVRDNFNNITEVITPLTSAPTNIQIKDASDITSGDYRLAIIWHSVPGAAHYNILRTTDGSTYNKISEATENGYLNMNLSQGTTYGYKVTAQDSSGNISLPAGPVSSEPGSAPDVTSPPQVEIFGWKQDVGVRVRVTWHTDQSSDSFVAYSTDPLSSGTALTTTNGTTDSVKVVGSPDLKTDHEIMLYNLNPSTKYYFKVLSKNQIQITGASDVYDFTTPERILLTISGLKILDITNTQALVSWTTSKLSTTKLEYGKSVNYESNILDETMNTDHKFQLTNLTAGEYHLRVNATDSDGNVTISDDYTFTIPETPVISGLSISEVGDNGATISWTTNVPCDSNVDFVASDKVGGSQGDGTRLTTHKVKLIGLDSKTTYSIKARSTDQYGNVALSGEQSFTTTADTQAPQILNQKSEVSSTGAGDSIKYQLIVSWETDEPATSKIEYAAGMGENYDSASREDLSLNMTHVVIISDLKPNSLYHFRIKSMDKAGNTAYSDDYTITTPPKEKNILTIIINAVIGPINDIYSGLMQKFRLR